MIVVAHVGGLPVEETVAQLAPLGIVVLFVARERTRRLKARLRGAGPNLHPRSAGAALGIALVIVAVTVANSVAAAGPSRRPDLMVMSLTAAPTELAPGSSFSEGFKEKNRGRARARRTATGFYLSPARRLGRGATGLLGRGRLKALRPRKRGRGRAQLVVPAEIAPGSYFLIACADAGRKVRERNERNNCRAARGRVVVAAGNGGGPAGCVPAADRPDLAFADTNCDGIDGDASDAIFVSPGGKDSDPGTRAAPKRTLAWAVDFAAEQGKDVYAAEGTYPELLIVTNGVGVYGGYDASWQRGLSNETRITGYTLSDGSTEGAEAFEVTDSTTLQLLTLMPSAPSIPGASSYGLRGFASGGLALENVLAIAAPGVPGLDGYDGTVGQFGNYGADGVDFGHGGTSPVEHPGGDGGPTNYSSGEAPGHPGVKGRTWAPDAFGKQGGEGGEGGEFADPGGDGEPGHPGDDGVAGVNGSGGTAANAGDAGSWQSAPGHDGTRGSGGHGGGGGGGGGTEDCTCITGDLGGYGGGGGGGGQGGSPGTGGQGGGGSFGIFLIESPGAVVRNSTVTAADGGAGGNGGDGAEGGRGGDGGQGEKKEEDGGTGGHGGLGGHGGPGGHGGGGAGGPSVAIFGINPSDAPGTSVSHGSGGSGGVPGGPAKGHAIFEFGAFGLAADYHGGPSS